MTFVAISTPPQKKLREVIFKCHHCICLKIPEILRYHMIFHCRMTSDPAGAELCNCTCTLFSVTMLFMNSLILGSDVQTLVLLHTFRVTSMLIRSSMIICLYFVSVAAATPFISGFLNVPHLKLSQNTCCCHNVFHQIYLKS